MDSSVRTAELRVAYEEHKTSTDELERLVLKCIELLERCKKERRWKSIYKRRLKENGWQKDRARRACNAANKKFMRILMKGE
jgi:hypothetical protein